MTAGTPVEIVIPSLDGSALTATQEVVRQGCQDWACSVVTGIAPAGRARNRGAASAGGEFLIFLDDDVRLSSSGVLREMVRVLAGSGYRDAVSITWRLPANSPWLRRALWGQARYTFRRDQTVAELSWRECGAACFAVRARWFEELNGFDEHLVSAEDSDLAYRITRAGGKIYTLPGAWILHDCPSSLGSAIRKTFWYERGNAQMARKHPDADHRVRLDRAWKAVAYLLMRSLALLPLLFLRVNYLQRRPRLEVRPLEALLSYIGAWAYAAEWILPQSGAKTRNR